MSGPTARVLEACPVEARFRRVLSAPPCRHDLVTLAARSGGRFECDTQFGCAVHGRQGGRRRAPTTQDAVERGARQPFGIPRGPGSVGALRNARRRRHSTIVRRSGLRRLPRRQVDSAASTRFSGPVWRNHRGSRPRSGRVRERCTGWLLLAHARRARRDATSISWHSAVVISRITMRHVPSVRRAPKGEPRHAARP